MKLLKTRVNLSRHNKISLANYFQYIFSQIRSRHYIVLKKVAVKCCRKNRHRKYISRANIIFAKLFFPNYFRRSQRSLAFSFLSAVFLFLGLRMAQRKKNDSSNNDVTKLINSTLGSKLIFKTIISFKSCIPVCLCNIKFTLFYQRFVCKKYKSLTSF